MSAAFFDLLFQEGSLAFGLQCAGGRHQVVLRQGNSNVEAAKFGVELAHVQVRHSVPAVLIINGGFRVPLGELVGLPLVAQAGKGAGQLYPERGRNANFPTGSQRFIQYQ